MKPWCIARYSTIKKPFKKSRRRGAQEVAFIVLVTKLLLHLVVVTNVLSSTVRFLLTDKASNGKDCILKRSAG